jgi:formylglycine-generating enzyme required for sulfatase activity
VSISDPGVAGHEAFIGEMSAYETTNAQYCLFLNAALASGDITVGPDNIVYGANGSNSGADFAGEIYFNTYAASSYSRITYSGGTFSVRTCEDIDYNDIDMSDHPVVEVSWYGAAAFCNYYGVKLPTEWQWQAVADHTTDDPYTYGCGNLIDFSRANYYDSGYANPLKLSDYPYTGPVGYYILAGYGIYDMAGNVWEWTSSLYSPAFSYRMIRGGGWDDFSSYCQVSNSDSFYPHETEDYIGFRVCR